MTNIIHVAKTAVVPCTFREAGRHTESRHQNSQTGTRGFRPPASSLSDLHSDSASLIESITAPGAPDARLVHGAARVLVSAQSRTPHGGGRISQAESSAPKIAQAYVRAGALPAFVVVIV